jgi:hypothetical protein
MGKIMTVGIVSLSAIEGIGAHRVHSSESVDERGVVAYLGIGFTARLKWTLRTQRTDGFTNLTTKLH